MRQFSAFQLGKFDEKWSFNQGTREIFAQNHWSNWKKVEKNQEEEDGEEKNIRRRTICFNSEKLIGVPSISTELRVFTWPSVPCYLADDRHAYLVNLAEVTGYWGVYRLIP
jgi:hypothetical protein